MKLCAKLLLTSSLITTVSYADPVAISNQPVPAPTTTPQPAVVIDCKYKPAEDATVSKELLTKWANHAAKSAFSYSYQSIDTDLSKLKPCFTSKGWQSFNKALTKSGNIAAIKEQQLSVTSDVVGKTTVISDTPKNWKVVVPLTVSYKNTQQNLSQPMQVTLDIGMKINGELGINQVIASAKNSSDINANQVNNTADDNMQNSQAPNNSNAATPNQTSQQNTAQPDNTPAVSQQKIDTASQTSAPSGGNQDVPSKPDSQ